MLITPKGVRAHVVLCAQRSLLLVEGMKNEISYINHNNAIRDHFLKSQLSLNNPSLGQHHSFAYKTLRKYFINQSFS